MDATTFDVLSRAFILASTRRRLLALLRVVPLTGVLAALHDGTSAAKGSRRRTRQRRRADRQHLHDAKKKKKKCAQAGQPTNKKRRQCCPGLVKDGSGLCAVPSSSPPGAPPPPPCVSRTCPPAPSCGRLPDGCGGTLTCGCTGNSVCHGGACQPCTVTCPSGSDPVTCGNDLQAVLANATAGATVYVCPGRYGTNFTIDKGVRVIGAGEGDDPTSNSILDAGGQDLAGRVLEITAAAGPVELERLRITGGNTPLGGGDLNAGAGIRLYTATLHMTECTVSGNITNGTSAQGGGIASGGTLQMTRCTIRDNHAINSNGGGLFTSGTTTLTDCLVEDNDTGGSGGGIFAFGGMVTLAGSTQVRRNVATGGGGILFNADTLVIAETCRVTENTANVSQGGGILRVSGTVTLQGTHPSPIVVNNCHENCVGTVDWCSTASPDPGFCPP